MAGPENQSMSGPWNNLTICIPAYNEEGAIRGTLEVLTASFPGAEILVVDDGSSDGTAKAARSVGGVTVLSHGRNVGYGGAIKTAMRTAKRPVVAWCDSDGQHSPADLARVAGPVLEGQRDVVIGVREKGSDARLDRRPGKWLLRVVAQLVARDTVPDLNSGLRCFRRNVIMKYIHLLPNGFSASSTSTLIMMRRGYRLGYEPIHTNPRTGTSTVRIFRDGWRTIHLLVRILVLFDAFAFFSILAGLQVLLGVGYGVTLAVVNRLGFPVLGSVVVISGLMTFFMGLICDQIVAMRMERFESSSSDARDG